MGCRRMLGVEDRATIMAGVNAGLSHARIAHIIGRSPSVVCREIARHTGPDGQYRAEEADKAARAAMCRPKKRPLDCDEVLCRRVIADLSQGHTPLHGYFSRRSQRNQPRGVLHMVRFNHESLHTRHPDHQRSGHHHGDDRALPLSHLAMNNTDSWEY